MDVVQARVEALRSKLLGREFLEADVHALMDELAELRSTDPGGKFDGALQGIRVMLSVVRANLASTRRLKADLLSG